MTAPADWHTQALCIGVDPAVFFPGSGVNGRAAKRICMACPVRAACLAEALRCGDEHGIRGGTSAKERSKLRASVSSPVDQPATKSPVTRHGYSAYTRGCHCDTCKKGKRDYQNARRANGRHIANTRGDTTPIPNITHGLASFDEQGCRCLICRSAKARSDAATRARRQARKVS